MATRKPLVLVSGLFQELATPTDKLDFAGNTTTDLAEGTSLYYTDTRARQAISVTDSGGDGSLSYNNSTGVITYTGPSATEVRAHFGVAVGSGLTYNSTTGVFGTSAIPNSQLANSSVTFGTTTVSLGGSSNTISGLNTVTASVLNALDVGTSGSISIFYDSIAFEGTTADANQTYLKVVDPTADRYITFPDASGTVALLTSISVSNSGAGFGSLSYNSTTGVITYNVVTAADIRGNFTASTTGTGYGSLTYNSSTGNYDFAVVTNANIRSAFSVAVGSGLTYDNSTGVFGTSAIPNSQLANSSITIGSSSVALGGTITTIAGLLSLTSSTVLTNDGGFRVRNSTDNTKQIAFDASGITTATVRTLTVPDLSGTLALREASNTFTNASGQRFQQAATQDSVIITGRAGGTSSYAVTVTPTTLTSNQTVTFPDLTGTVLLDSSPIPGGTFLDDTFRISDNLDNTKKLAFQCSGISTATTRTMTVPDENGTIATQDFATAIAIALG